jgi:type IV fimbrial biogenesis protein FimT
MVRLRIRPSLRARGFTLPELMVGVAVMGILGAIAAPSFSTLVGNMRARGTSSDLYAAVVRARSEALKLNAEVKLVPASGSTTWQAGWSIQDPADATSKLDDHPAVKGATISGPATLVFQPNGRVKGGGEPAFDIAVSGSTQHRCITIDLGGRPKQTTGGCT